MAAVCRTELLSRVSIAVKMPSRRKKFKQIKPEFVTGRKF